LRHIDLSRNQLTRFATYGQLRHLQILHLSCNQLVALQFEELPSLTELYLSKNRIQTLPPSIGSLSSLKTLCLSQNLLKSLPPELGQLDNLLNLYLNNNQLETLPPSICCLTTLQVLEVMSNQLTYLPFNMDGMSSLVKLNLGHNNLLRELPEDIWRSSSLQDLDLFNCNSLRAPPLEVRKMGWKAMRRFIESPELMDYPLSPEHARPPSSPTRTSKPPIRVLRFLENGESAQPARTGKRRWKGGVFLFGSVFVLLGAAALYHRRHWVLSNFYKHFGFLLKQLFQYKLMLAQYKHAWLERRASRFL